MTGVFVLHVTFYYESTKCIAMRTSRIYYQALNLGLDASEQAGIGTSWTQNVKNHNVLTNPFPFFHRLTCLFLFTFKSIDGIMSLSGQWKQYARMSNPPSSTSKLIARYRKSKRQGKREWERARGREIRRESVGRTRTERMVVGDSSVWQCTVSHIRIHLSTWDIQIRVWQRNLALSAKSRRWSVAIEE